VDKNQSIDKKVTTN